VLQCESKYEHQMSCESRHLHYPTDSSAAQRNSSWYDLMLIFNLVFTNEYCSEI
jgi:hypothetical protein